MADKTGLIIDIGGFPAEGISEVRLSADISIPKSYCDEEKASVTVVGKLKRNTEDVFTFEGSIQADLMLKCDLCLDNFLKSLNFRLKEFSRETAAAKKTTAFREIKSTLKRLYIPSFCLTFL